MKCVAGCKAYTGGEIKHHPDCPFYPESLSKMYDDLVNDRILVKCKKEKNMITITVRVEDVNGQRWQDVSITKKELIQFACNKVANMYEPKPHVNFSNDEIIINLNCV